MGAVSRALKLACAIALCSACREPEDIAQTIVWVDVESAAREKVSHVVVQAIGPAENRLPAVETKEPKWPIKLVLAPKNEDPSRRFTLQVEARDAQDKHLVTLQFATGFVAHQTRYAKLLIHDACVAPHEKCNTSEPCNVWTLQLAASELSRSSGEPRQLDALCADQDAMPPSAAGDAGTMSGTTSDASTAGSGATSGAAGSGQAGTTGQNGGCAPGTVRRGNDCVDVQDCQTAKSCGDHGHCQNIAGDDICQCDPGFQNESGSCVDVDECQLKNGDCEHTCQNSTGGMTCTCPQDEWLKADRKSCGSFSATKRISIGWSVAPTQPQFAFDAHGNGLAVWTQSDGSTQGLWSRRYVTGTGWAGTATRLTIPDDGNANNPRVTLDADGRGIVVWRQTQDSDGDIWAARYDGQSLTESGRIDEQNMGDASEPSVELAANGDGFAVWTQGDGHIWFNRFIADKGWQGAESIKTSDEEQAYGAQVALDSFGNASLVWTQSMFVPMSMPRFSPWSARFDPKPAKWKAAIPLDENEMAGAPNHQLWGQDGKAVAVWPRMTGAGRVTVRASQSSEKGDWNDSTDITMVDSGLTSVVPRIALASSGRGAAIWTQFQAGIQVWANRYDGTSGQWSGAQQLSSIETTISPAPQLAVDPNGDGFGVWSEIRGTERVIKAWRLQSDAGFSGGIALSTDTTASPAVNSPVQIDVDAQGSAVVIWDVFEQGQYHTAASTLE
jgi:hypothetical protein